MVCLAERLARCKCPADVVSGRDGGERAFPTVGAQEGPHGLSPENVGSLPPPPPWSPGTLCDVSLPLLGWAPAAFPCPGVGAAHVRLLHHDASSGGCARPGLAHWGPVCVLLGSGCPAQTPLLVEQQTVVTKQPRLVGWGWP